VYYFGSLT